jgi:hypothetical protein
MRLAKTLLSSFASTLAARSSSAAPAALTRVASSKIIFQAASQSLGTTRTMASALMAAPSIATRVVASSSAAAGRGATRGGGSRRSFATTRAVATDGSAASSDAAPSTGKNDVNTALLSSELTWPARDQTCGDLREGDDGRMVTLCGWVDKQRDMGGIVFADVRDHTGAHSRVFRLVTWNIPAVIIM